MLKHKSYKPEVKKQFQSLTSESIEKVEVKAKIEKVSITITKEEPVQPTIEEKPLVKSSVPDVIYRQVVYLGIAKQAERIGMVTSNSYIFKKDNYRMPVATQIDERDYIGLIIEKGKGCARKDASILFMSKLEWDLELEQARIANNS